MALHPVAIDPAALLEDVTEMRRNPRTVSLDEELSLRRWCRERALQSASAIQRLVDRGHLRNARREARAHMRRKEVLVDALFRAARKEWPTRKNMSLDQAELRRKRRLRMVFEQVGVIGMFHAPAKARQRRFPKKDGGTRKITSFYWVDKARQLVLKAALTPFADLHTAQFMLSRDRLRRGTAAVRKALLTSLSQCGHDCLFLHFDIVDFYGSISHEWLERNLGIDNAIIHRQTHTGGMKIVPADPMAPVRDDHEATQEKGRWGIPQGSALSALIAEQVMASVLRSVAALDGLPLFAWSDNVGVIVPRERAGAIESHVREAFASHGAGPFQLSMSAHPVTSPFKFLGTWYQKTGEDARASIPKQVIDAWVSSIGSRLVTCWDDEIDDIERHVDGKAAQWGWFEPFRRTERAVRHLIGTRRACCHPAFQR